MCPKMKHLFGGGLVPQEPSKPLSKPSKPALLRVGVFRVLSCNLPRFEKTQLDKRPLTTPSWLTKRKKTRPGSCVGYNGVVVLVSPRLSQSGPAYFVAGYRVTSQNLVCRLSTGLRESLLFLRRSTIPGRMSTLLAQLLCRLVGGQKRCATVHWCVLEYRTTLTTVTRVPGYNDCAQMPVHAVTSSYAETPECRQAGRRHAVAVVQHRHHSSGARCARPLWPHFYQHPHSAHSLPLAH